MKNVSLRMKNNKEKLLTGRSFSFYLISGNEMRFGMALKNRFRMEAVLIKA